MSGPFRFQAEEARSPLDRSVSPFSAGQPVSFKTNINRAKTMKWVQAKKNAYDGDDWGDYDQYDEYGVNQEPHQPQEQAQRYYAQRTEQPSRSFTDPSQQAPLTRGRRNSFERGEEQRAFSTTIPHPQHGHGQQYEDPRGQTSAGGYDQGSDTGDRGDFSPSAMPPPLQTRISQVPADFTPSINTQLPPRKSSIGQGDMPMPTSPRSRHGSHSDKPLPFIRPSDIYKRHEEEQQRASLESSRPSLDSLSSPTRDKATPPQEGARSLQPMETVAERNSEYDLPGYDAAAPHHDKQQQSQQDQSLVSPKHDQGLRSVVDQAFTRADESRSVPPTPISNDNDSSSDLLRSNTGSTSGISPIMSRVPSSAASAVRSRNQAEGNTPAIAEEPSETTTPITQPTSANVIEPMHHVPRKPSPGHNRNFSNSSMARSDLATPTRGDSPARSPVLAPSRDVPEPESALVTTESNEISDTMEGGLQGPSPAYAAREADIATAARNGPDSGAPELGAAELRSQNTFLESHNAQSPVDDILPRDRSESPSKGRVQALAGKFGEVASSRRGSTQSNRSRNSLQSWERSNDNSRAASPTKATSSKPSSPVKEFRPHLPGQWESYATTAMTPSDRDEQDRGLSLANNGPNSLNNFDLTPTTAKQSVAGMSSGETETSDPIAALKDAGAAMVNSIRTTLGAAEESETQQQQGRRTDDGNIYIPRPLQLDRTVTSNSSVPPTPPAKDTPELEFPPPPLKEKSPQFFNGQPERPSLDPQLSTDASAEDQESDRLRKEIVASLSPFKAPASPVSESNRASPQPVSPGANRASSILPSEYDTYWADEDRASRRSSQDDERHPQEQPSGATVPSLPQSEEPTKPVILNRFSWEASNSQLQTPDEQAQGAPMVEPTKASQVAAIPSPPAERAADQEHRELSEGLPDSNFGPDHTFTVTEPDPSSDTDMPPQTSSPPLDTARSLTSLSTSPTREDTRSPGLHVVNTELNPEAVDLPPRFSAEHEQSPGPKEPELSEKQQLEQPAQNPAIVPSNEDATTPTAVQDSSPKSPTTDKPLGAREIATLATSAERIGAYNATREYWAKHDHGLNDWLRSALEAKPDLANHNYPMQRVPTSSARHKHAGSLALFGKLGGPSSHDVSSEQPNNTSVSVPAHLLPPTTGAPSGSGFGGRIANQQMQLKGKDLLHTANVLGGKGMTSAKGLFAKGKSRFGREKTSHARADSAPSSREASEEPELVTRRSIGMYLIRSLTEKEKDKKEEAPNEEMKKRRFSFSSQFRRGSRPGSRPSSVALPKETPSVSSSTPKTSPPCELHHYLMGERRPHSFHAPDSWVGTPPTTLNEYFSTTPPRRSSSQPRLGILPSPAKSAFSNQDRDTEGHVPPVPPIPNEVAIKHYRRRSSQDSASHGILQSVVRHSKPPIVPNRHSMPAAVTRDPKSREHHAVFAEDYPLSSAQERADYKSFLRAPEGSLQPDLPTAESGDLRRDGFQCGFGNEASKRPKNDGIDDNGDQPPQLNDDPLPASSQLVLQQPSMYTNKHLHVSDGDSDREPIRGRDLAPFPRLDTKQKADSISPVLPPVGTSSGVVSNMNDETVSIECDELARGTGIVRYEDTRFVLLRRQLDDVVAADRPVPDPISAIGSQEHPKEFAKHSELVEDDQIKSKVEKTHAERAASPVWFAKSDLHLPNPSIRGGLGDAGESAQVRATTPAKERDENASSLPTPSLEATSLSDALAGANAADSDTSTRRVTTPPPRGIDAVEGHSASDSVDMSWDQRCTIEPRAVAGDSDTMRDESDRVTPVAQLPQITQDGPETPKAEDSHTDNSHPIMSNGYGSSQASFADFKHQARQLQVATAPERSRSILSQISAMVSDEGSNAYSQTSTGRSTPSTIRRMQPDSTMKPSAAPPQILEEVLTSYGDHTANGDADDFDLYADHNGVVKDVRDESGRPLRLTNLQVPGTTPQPQPTKSSTSDIGTAPASRNGDGPRYSFERPMSFISGPEDQDGKPQDQINQAASSRAMQMPPTPQQHRNQSHQQPPMGTVYSMNPPANMASPSEHMASRHQPAPAAGPTSSKNIFQAVKSIDPGSKTTQATINSWRPSGPHEAQAHAQANGPRNQFELHQQMMQRQAQYPRHHDAELRPPTASLHLPAEQAPRQQEKQPSKSKLSSMFKNLGGKAQANSQHPPSTGNTAMSSDSRPLSPNTHHGAPMQSVMDRFTRPREASAERPIEEPRSFVPPNRPNMGQQPQFIQTPLTVPSVDLQPDSRKPMISAPSNGVPLQQPPPMPNAHVQPHQVTQSRTPENGKKMRFSAFGALFNRGANGDGLATKYKLPKEGKKVQKAQRNSAVPIAQPPASQRLPQQQPYKPQHSGLAYYPPGQLPPHTVQNEPPMGPKLGPSQLAPNMHPQEPSQQYQQAQQVPLPQNSIPNTHPDEVSAFLKTKQLAMEQQARQSGLQSYQAHNPNIGTAARPSSRMSEKFPPHMRHPSLGPPPVGYYNPHAEQASVEPGAYAASFATRQQAEYRKQQHTAQQGPFAVPQTERQHEKQRPEYGQNVYREPQYVQHPERQAQLESSSEQLAHQAWLAQREQLLQQEQLANGHDRSWPNDDARAQQLHQQQPNHTEPLIPYHNASDPRLHHPSQDAIPISPPGISPSQEPRYEAPPIPAAYSPVSGAFVSPLDRPQQPLPGRFDRQASEPRVQAVSPQVSAQSPAPPNGRSHSDASTMSLVSPISNSPALPNSSPTPGGQRYQKPRMSSISEVHQHDRPWHLNFPEGATEQEIVRARQGQYMQERFTAQRQQQAERAAEPPSPRASPAQATPMTAPPHAQAQSGGFRELLPRPLSQPYAASQDAQSSHDVQPMVRFDAAPVQFTPIRSEQSPPPAAAYPLPMSPDPSAVSNPMNPVASGFPPSPPPRIAHSPIRSGFPRPQPFSFEEQRQHPHMPSSQDDGYGSPPRIVPQYDEQVPDEAPPSYDGLGVPNDGMNKSRPEALRPPNIMTDLEYESRGRQQRSRPRQPSIGILQHPQPASMAASPQRKSPDMGAESLRRQLLQQENLAHMERVQREQEQREKQERERQERDTARARARELERSASGGGQVHSLRSVGGSTTGGAPGWERRGSHSRPVFELPAVEDDEPTMKATSYPGQEWVPPMWDGD